MYAGLLPRTFALEAARMAAAAGAITAGALATYAALLDEFGGPYLDRRVGRRPQAWIGARIARRRETVSTHVGLLAGAGLLQPIPGYRRDPQTGQARRLAYAYAFPPPVLMGAYALAVYAKLGVAPALARKYLAEGICALTAPNPRTKKESGRETPATGAGEPRAVGELIARALSPP